MYLIIWQYNVKPAEKERFIEIYNADGRWAELFRDSAGYQGTVLMKSSRDAHTYITLDYWDSEQEFRRFLKKNQATYDSIDRECEGMTESEVRIGEYITP